MFSNSKSQVRLYLIIIIIIILCLTVSLFLFKSGFYTWIHSGFANKQAIEINKQLIA